ncbi:hypothetical protein CFE70_008068 [Pyrenophora teres f. teres 0-1]|uniref:Histone H4 n=2 Tax=Pyrenophora teres f. teres TaxID=97479 RepID=E3S2K1_PYRTT|nr:hypothetical protein PTT_16543 [Pyrenophora teres f. teres 0-1]KAE8828787.1 hypothetical protein PTNB85_07975 [Pyrenophora teres f. teres]KAE8829949.1 hypothetical protein HRS9139_06573 [Pyrenophora teres f. teres]KAE8841712.1 hypothetical protein HRS9122_05838 [Pyrenophora teres f. teres]KAE8859815.1 hypothetical protein PTNB29_07046 [Pyrenophora teres f. teres]
MPNKRPKQFGGSSRYGASARPHVRPQSSATSATPQASRASQMGLGLGKGAGGLEKGKGLARGSLKRHMKIQKDNIYGVTKGDIRRLARRGGVKRISATIYDDVRDALRQRLRLILQRVCAVIDSSGRKTVSVSDIVFTLRGLGNPIYGFEPSFLRER